MNKNLQDQFINDMLTESHEGLDRYDAHLLSLEKGEAEADAVNDIFRVIHTLKGTAGCLGFHKIEHVAHAGENLLDPVRNGQLEITKPIIAVLLKLSDALRNLLKCIEAKGSDTDGPDDSALVQELDALRANGGKEVAVKEEKPAWGLFDAAAAEPSSQGPSAAPVEGEGWGLFDSAPKAPEVAAAPPVQPAGVEDAKAQKAAAASASAAPSQANANSSGASVRVDVSLLDKLMNLVGELVLARNQLSELSQNGSTRPDALSYVAQRLNVVTGELQEGIMKTRMQPVGNVWSKFPRVVRDIASELGKQVRLETFGSETELDRTIIEAIKDPLTHIIRNSIDHGIESPERRLAAGKAAEGMLVMRAYNEDGRVTIEINDDGAGINLKRVRQKAIERGMVSAEQASNLSEAEVVNLIFQPGFSTAEKITNVSGRGVGMDVVKTNIEKIGGTVEVQTAEGQGTTLKIRIPLTLAIVPAVIVRSGGMRFALPQISVQELIRFEGEEADRAIERVYGAPVFRLRGELVPVIRLNDVLKLKSDKAENDRNLFIVLLTAEQRTYGLVVDEICENEEIVVKPLGRHLAGITVFGGATIMGDGRVALILNAIGLAKQARVLGDERERSARESAQKAAVAADSRTHLVIFSLPGRERLAMKLDDAARLEEFPADRIEVIGQREAIQYRGKILPLIRLSRHLATQANERTREERVQVVVCQQGQVQVGFVVGRILDILAEQVDFQPASGTAGVSGAGIVQGKITEFIDVPALVRASGALTAGKN